MKKYNSLDYLLQKNLAHNLKDALDLLSLERGFVKCHFGCMRVFLDCGGILVTAYVDGRDCDRFDSVRIVHSFIRKKSVCIDYTSNLVILEEGYNRLSNLVVTYTIFFDDFLKDRNAPIRRFTD